LAADNNSDASHKSALTSSLTIGAIISAIFPYGTAPPQQSTVPTADGNVADGDGKGAKAPEEAAFPWIKIPTFAADLFAVCAYIIDHVGAMGYFDAEQEGCAYFGGDPEFGDIQIGIKELYSQCKMAANEWRENGEFIEGSDAAQFVGRQWEALIQHWRAPASITFYKGWYKSRQEGQPYPDIPTWWQAVFCLLIIADQACDGVGHFLFEAQTGQIKGGGHYFDANFVNKTPDALACTARLARENRWHEPGTDGQHRAKKSINSLAMLAHRALICVQPKGRVTSVGHSVRNLTRNLANVGPLGVVRTNWQQLSQACQPPRFDTLNLLLIPLPYAVDACQFKSFGDSCFKIDQNWLGGDARIFIEEVCKIVRRASEDGPVDGVIFPEYALTWDLFQALLEPVSAASKHKVQFMLSGSSTNCEGQSGNIVLTSIWESRCSKSDDDAGLATQIRTFSQRKHQRWKLDKSQIASYALGGSLSPNKGHWEHHFIGRREQHFFQLSPDTIFTSLICEDLARNDPCHDIIRSVAPNLVFALLMDGPQLGHRWPARYAGSLADDPGCTVLSFTSYALLGRSNNQRPDRKSHAVGLLRDSIGQTKEILLPDGKDAIIVTLASDTAEDTTIDGRQTRYASEWRFVSQTPISAGVRTQALKPKPRTKNTIFKKRTS
jgi:hypothetical protein